MRSIRQKKTPCAGQRRALRGERGATLLEFAIGATVFLSAIFMVLEGARLLWTHNALSDAARRGARYAVTRPATDAAAVRNVAVYGSPQGGAQPLVNDLGVEHITVQYSSDFGLAQGTVSVQITDYQFRFVVPLWSGTITLPPSRTTLTAENAGLVPEDVNPPAPSPTPTPTPVPTPTPTPTPSPSPTPRACARGERPAQTGCVCQPPMWVRSSGRCM